MQTQVTYDHMNRQREIVDKARIDSLQASIQKVVNGSSVANDSHINFDTAGTLFFARELEYVESEIYKVEHTPLMARRVIPVDSSGGPWTDTVTYRVFDRVGKSVVVNSHNASDIPLINLTAKEVTGKIRELADAFQYTIGEIERARHTNTPLENESALAARDIIETDLNEIAFKGDSENDLPGLLTNPNIPKSNAANGANGTPEWSTKTANEILFDMIDALADVREQSNGVETANTILLPVAQYELLLQPLNTAGYAKTILSWLVENTPYISSNDSIIPVHELKGAGTNGVDIMMVYDKNPRKLVQRIPMDIQVLSPQLKDLAFKSVVRAKTGGTAVRYPLSLKIIEKI